MPVSKQERDRRVVAGLCEQCGNEPCDGNTRKGISCKAVNKQSRQDTKERKRQLGICTQAGCSNPAKDGCIMCQGCIDKSSVGTSRAYRKKKAARCCPYCPEGTPIEPGHKACRAHLDKINTSGQKNYRKCKEAGLCYFCGHPKKPAIPGTPYCAEHKVASTLRSKRGHQSRRRRVLDHYGHKCACCGLTIPAALQIDHMHGGGTQHLKTIGRGGLYRWLIKNNFPAGYQTLCVLCNWMKRNYGACPHTTMPYEAQQLTWRYTKELSKILKSSV